MPRPLNEQFKLALEGTMALTYLGLGILCVIQVNETSEFLGIPRNFIFALGVVLSLYGGFRGWRFWQNL